MKQSVIYLPVQIDGADFRHFALFDAFTRRKMWRRPAVFTAILTVSAALCYSRYPQEGSVLLGTILLVLGVGMPLVWYLSYEHSLHVQAKKMGLLKAPRRVYTLVFAEEGIQISQDLGKTFTPLSWGSVTAVYRRPDITYLYAGERAWLLPHSQVREGESSLRALLARRLPPEALHDVR